MNRGRRIRSGVAVVAILCSATLFAQQRVWTAIGTFEDDNATLLLDRASLSVNAQTRVIWVKVERVKPMDWKGGQVQSWLSQIEVNCQLRTQRTRYEIGYRPDSSVAYQFNGPGEATPVVPDTVGEERLAAICKLPAKTTAKQ